METPKQKNTSIWFLMIMSGTAALIVAFIALVQVLANPYVNLNGKLTEAVFVSHENEACSIPVHFLTSRFAKEVTVRNGKKQNDKGNGLYIVMDQSMHPYLVEMDDQTFLDYLPLYQYTYHDQAPDPGITVMKGRSVRMSQQVEKATMAAYNNLFGVPLLNERNFNSYFGKYYFVLGSSNTSLQKALPGCLFFLVIGLILLITGLLHYVRNREYNRMWKETYDFCE